MFTSGVSAFFEMPTSDAKRILPAHLQPVEVRHERSILSVTAFHFSDSVVGPYAELTDAWATAAFVLGPVEGLAALEAHPDLEGVLVEQDAHGKLVLHRTSGMAALEIEQ